MKIKTRYKQTKICELVELTVGGTWGPESDETNGVPVLRSTNFTKDQKIVFENIAYRDITEAKLTNRVLNNGDFLIEISGGGPSQPVGRALEFINPDGKTYTYGNFVRRLKLNSDLLTQEYLSLALKALYIFGETEPIQTNTTNLRNLNFKDYINLEIPVPTIQEQKQIVSKIKECFTLLDKSEAKLKNAETKSKIFLDSILKKNLDINSAKVVEIDEIATLINGDRGKNYPNKSALVKSGIPFITAGHIQNHKIDYVEMNYITEERYEILNNGKIQKDDILFCLRGSLGKVAIVEDTNKGAIASSLVIIRPNTDIMSKYLYYYLLSQYGQNQIREYDNGTAQPNLSASNLKKFIIRVPEIDKQKEIIKQVEQLSSIIDTIKRNLLMQRDTYSNLRQSILKKAFEGKLI